ncbi:MAG TPA: carboxypeptidase regulatory-like domain-containing protein, partial [Desulfotomaculum sp.]|nr:carboxypeptidase regulatory-like domain-containing protein [Desulfotomaculum sp.]
VPQYIRWTVTDRSGHYRLAGMPPGIYAVSVYADWYAPAARILAVKAGVVTTADFLLKGPFGALGGRVTDYQGNGIAGAMILALPEDEWAPPAGRIEALDASRLNALQAKAVYRTRTDQNGYYFIPLVKPGAYWVVAVWQNNAQFKEAKVLPRQMTRVDFRFPPYVSPHTSGGVKQMQRDIPEFDRMQIGLYE